MNKFAFCASLLCYSLNLMALEPNLCIENEKVYFSCATGEKVISVCASNPLTVDVGTLTYRFGKLDLKPELEYSSDAKNFSKKFKIAFDSYAKGSTLELSFKIGAYTYLIHEDSHVYKGSSAGLFILRNSKQLKYFACNNDILRYGGLSSLFDLEKAGFPKEEYPTFIGTKSEF